MSRVGVFGGTFDPVHLGHLAIANAALEELGLDELMFMPARRSPLKGQEPVAPARDRLAMLELATAGEPRFTVSSVELDRPGPSYTVDTLSSLGGRGELFLLLGADAYAELARWKDPERVRQLASIVVAARPGVGVPKDVRLLDAPLMDISSRDLRERAARGRSLRYLVPGDALRYITEHHLYR